MMQVKLWGSSMKSAIDRVNAALACNPAGIVVKLFAFARDAYEGSVSLKSLEQSQVHVCDKSEITSKLWTVGAPYHALG